MNYAGLADEIAPVLRELVDAIIAPLLARLEKSEKRVAELEARPLLDIEVVVAHAIRTMEIPTAEAVAAFIPKPADGESVTVDDLRPLVDEIVSAKVAEIPAPLDGKDAEPDAVRAMVDEAVKALPPAKNGKDADPALIERAVKAAMDALPRPQDGKSVVLEDVRPLIDECVARAAAALPVPKDGVGLAGAVIDRDGNLTLTLTDGSLKGLGVVIGKDGDPGKPGIDGLGFDDLDVVDHGLEFALKFTRGDQIREFRLAKPTLADQFRNIWKEGSYRRGDVVLRDGSPWLAMADTETRPGADGSDWVLFAKKGRDGKDGMLLAPKPREAVKL